MAFCRARVVKKSNRAHLFRSLDVCFTTIKVLLCDGNGNGVVVAIPGTDELYVSGYFRDKDEFYLVPINELEIMVGISPDRLTIGSRVEIGTEKIGLAH